MHEGHVLGSAPSCMQEPAYVVPDEVSREYEIESKRCGGRGGCEVYGGFARRGAIERVALKIVRSAFETISPSRARRLYREVAYLQILSGHPNIVRLRRAIVCAANDFVLVLDYAETDLRRAIAAGMLAPDERTFASYQLFVALAYMHSARIAHRDIQPSNLLLDKGCRLRICDLRSAKRATESEVHYSRMSDPKVGCDWYKPFESWLGDSRRNCFFCGDIWAAGCVLVEMEARKPIFAGIDATNIMARQLDALGAPPHLDSPLVAAAAARLQQGPTLFDLVSARSRQKRNSPAAQAVDRETVDWAFHLAQERRRADIIELASICLHLNPAARCDAPTAIIHPLFKAVVDDRPTVFPNTTLQKDLESHCGGTLDRGGKPWTTAQYRDKLSCYLATYSCDDPLPDQDRPCDLLEDTAVVACGNHPCRRRIRRPLNRSRHRASPH